MQTPTAAKVFADRLERVRSALTSRGVDAALVSVGPDMPWMIGYGAMPLERLTMLVVPADGTPTLVIPGFEVPRVIEHDGLFAIDGWSETDDPVQRVVDLVGSAAKLTIGDHTWARFLVSLQHRLPNTEWLNGSEVYGPLRQVKDEAEIEALQRAADGVDVVAKALQSGEIPLIGRTEAEVSREMFDVLFDAQARGVAAAQVGTPAEAVDAAARDHMAAADLDQWFLHRLGHGIGVEAHEDPYLVSGNSTPLVAGNAFSIEPGFYIEGKWGARIEDIVVATEDGPRPLNKADHQLAIVEA